MRQYNDLYLRMVARSAGVAYDDREDCMQELRLRLWQRPDAGWLDLRHWAIDFQRKLRHGWRQHAYQGEADIEDHAYSLFDPIDHMDIAEKIIDFEACWSRLTPSEQGWLTKACNGLSTSQSQRISQSRHHLRELAGLGSRILKGKHHA